MSSDLRSEEYPLIPRLAHRCLSSATVMDSYRPLRGLPPELPEGKCVFFNSIRVAVNKMLQSKFKYATICLSLSSV